MKLGKYFLLSACLLLAASTPSAWAGHGGGFSGHMGSFGGHSSAGMHSGNGGWHGGGGGGGWRGGWHGGGGWYGGWYGGVYFDPFFYDWPYYATYPDVVAAPDAPPAYMEAAPAAGAPQGAANDWYYCQNPAGYYPYVRSCSGGWQRVPAKPPGAP